MKEVALFSLLMISGVSTFAQLIRISIFNDSTLVDVMPQFNDGGNKGLMDVFLKNTHYPPEARENGIGGKVLAGITIDTAGSFDSVVIINSFNESLDNEVIRVINLTKGKWTPAIRNGTKINYFYRIPLSFKIYEGNRHNNSNDPNDGMPNAKSYYSLGVKNLKKADYETAYSCFSKELLINPFDPDGYLNRAKCSYALKNYKDACEDLKIALRLGRTDLKSMIEQGCN